MPLRLVVAFIATLIVSIPMSTAAQPAAGGAESASPSTQDKGALRAASPRYRSTLEGYRAYADQPVLPWREANDLVGRIGGWQAYARESQGAPPLVAPAPAAAASAPPGPTHHQHKR